MPPIGTYFNKKSAKFNVLSVPNKYYITQKHSLHCLSILKMEKQKIDFYFPLSNYK
jgi:hypothetical protein